jgi:hypothetical protein
VTIPASGKAQVTVSAWLGNVPAATWSIMSYQSSGGSGDIGASDVGSVALWSDGSIKIHASTTSLVTGLSPGSHTFTAKYRSSTGVDANFTGRSITVVGLP